MHTLNQSELNGLLSASILLCGSQDQAHHLIQVSLPEIFLPEGPVSFEEALKIIVSHWESDFAIDGAYSVPNRGEEITFEENYFWSLDPSYRLFCLEQNFNLQKVWLTEEVPRLEEYHDFYQTNHGSITSWFDGNREGVNELRSFQRECYKPKGNKNWLFIIPVGLAVLAIIFLILRGAI